MCRKVHAQVTNLSLYWNWPRGDALHLGGLLPPLTTPWGWWFTATNKGQRQSTSLCWKHGTDAITKSRKNLGDLNVLSSVIIPRTDNLYDHSVLLFTAPNTVPLPAPWYMLPFLLRNISNMHSLLSYQGIYSLHTYPPLWLLFLRSPWPLCISAHSQFPI